MNQNFPRIITLLRKERGLSQKSAAASLGVSQALLSHYEKGIRECGLDFVVKTADFYQVSADYLLGRTASRTGETISLDELPENDVTGKDNRVQGSMLPILNKKLINSSLNIIFALLQECNNRQLTTEISTYLFSQIYKIFRILYSANSKNPQGMFAVSPKTYDGLTQALSSIAETHARCLSGGEAVGNSKGISSGKAPSLSPEILSEKYPLFATALFNLIQSTEDKINSLGNKEE